MPQRQCPHCYKCGPRFCPRVFGEIGTREWDTRVPFYQVGERFASEEEARQAYNEAKWGLRPHADGSKCR